MTGTLTDAAAALRAGEVTSAELTEDALGRADDLADLGVFLARFDEEARRAARAADAELAAGCDRGPLHGLPIGVKDLIATREGPTTAQSLVVDEGWGRDDAPVVARLRAAGAVIVGKTSLMELAYATHDPSHPFPVPANPWDSRFWPGGSSSGSGAGVAAGMMLGALGTDTGGSVRVPAAMCGITGLKPTYGLVPLDGCIPLSWSQDHIGPMAPSSADCRAMLEVMAARALPGAERAADLGALKVGLVRLERLGGSAVDPAVPGLLDEAVGVLADLGAELVEVELPLYAEVVDAGFLTVAAERLAHHRERLPHRWSDYGRSARLGMARGAYYSAADYVQAQRVRQRAHQEVGAVFEEVDVLVSPMSAAPTPRLEDVETFMGTWKQLVHAPYWDALGNPALSLPMGFDHRGLPLAVQVVGRHGADGLVLAVGEAYQRVTDWHLRRPGQGTGRAG